MKRIIAIISLMFIACVCRAADPVPVFTDGTNMFYGAATNRVTNSVLYVAETPTADNEAASKKYVDDNAGGATTLSNLTDTVITTPAVGNGLRWDGTDWVNTSGTVQRENAVGALDFTTTDFATDGTWRDLALVMRDEVNRLRQNPTTVYPEVTKAQMVYAIYAKYLTCTNYNWMSTD